MSVQSSLQATTSLVSQTKHLSNQFRKSCSVKASTTSSSIDTNTFALHGKSGRKCMLTGKRANNGYTVSFSHIRNKKLQQANLQVRVRSRFMSPVGLRVCFPQRCPIILLFFIHPRSGFLSRNLPQKLTSWNFSFYLPFNSSYSTNAYTGRNKSDTFACAFPPKRLKL